MGKQGPKPWCRDVFSIRGPECCDPWDEFFAWDCLEPVDRYGRHRYGLGTWCRSEIVEDPEGRGTFRLYWPGPDFTAEDPDVGYDCVWLVVCEPDPPTEAEKVHELLAWVG